jgi:hypothetical protein
MQNYMKKAGFTNRYNKNDHLLKNYKKTTYLCDFQR